MDQAIQEATAGDKIISKKVKMPLLFYGGCGGHVVNDVAKTLEGVKYPRVSLGLQAFNTDSEDLEAINDTVTKTIIGMDKTGGWGAGADPEIGKAAAEDSSKEIIEAMQDGDIVVFFAGLGGGTGSGSLPYAVEQFETMNKDQADKPLHQKRAGIVIVTMPFSCEDEVVQKHAREAYTKLSKFRVPIIPIPNDKFFHHSMLHGKAELAETDLEMESEDPDLEIGIEEMFLKGNELLANMIGRMVRSLGSRHDIHNIDRNDIVSHLLLADGEPNLGYYGVGYSKEGESIEVALQMVATNPLLETNLSQCRKAIISIECENATKADYLAIQRFMTEQRKMTGAEWRWGLNKSFAPLAFEAKKDFKAAVFAIGIGCGEMKDQADQEIEQQTSQAIPATTKTKTWRPNEPPKPVMDPQAHLPARLTVVRESRLDN